MYIACKAGGNSTSDIPDMFSCSSIF